MLESILQLKNAIPSFLFRFAQYKCAATKRSLLIMARQPRHTWFMLHTVRAGSRERTLDQARIDGDDAKTAFSPEVPTRARLSSKNPMDGGWAITRHSPMPVMPLLDDENASLVVPMLGSTSTMNRLQGSVPNTILIFSLPPSPLSARSNMS